MARGQVWGPLDGVPFTLARHAANTDADFILFPELSLTGYEPRLAGALATEPNDNRLDTLQDLADSNEPTATT